MRKVELLSPAGCYDAFIGAVNAGADAVYLSGTSFGARAYADNFDNESLADVLDIAHLFNVKVYLTVNTLLKQKELDSLSAFLDELYKHHPDGIIVQDAGVISHINRYFPDIPVHLSTQLSSTCGFSADIFKKYNVSRIVPARELNIDEIRALKESTGLEIECFIHGAMCYSYSGRCLFSSILGGRSGNRGRCAQPCRLPYSANDSEDKYILSMSDMCTLDILDELIESGIDSFKIEGRMKKPEYAAGVTAIYRKYIDQVYKGEFHGAEDKDIEFIKNLYLRTHIFEGYYHIHNSKEMLCMDSPSYNGSDDEVLNSVHERYIRKKPTIGIDMNMSLRKGQNIKLYAAYDDISVSLSGPVPDQAKSSPLNKETIIKQLNKTGDTFFVPRKIEIGLDDGLFLNIATINGLRRELLDKLYDEIIKCNINSMSK